MPRAVFAGGLSVASVISCALATAYAPASPAVKTGGWTPAQRTAETAPLLVWETVRYKPKVWVLPRAYRADCDAVLSGNRPEGLRRCSPGQYNWWRTHRGWELERNGVTCWENGGEVFEYEIGRCHGRRTTESFTPRPPAPAPAQ